MTTEIKQLVLLSENKLEDIKQRDDCYQKRKEDRLLPYVCSDDRHDLLQHIEALEGIIKDLLTGDSKAINLAYDRGFMDGEKRITDCFTTPIDQLTEEQDKILSALLGHGPVLKGSADMFHAIKQSEQIP